MAVPPWNRQAAGAWTSWAVTLAMTAAVVPLLLHRATGFCHSGQRAITPKVLTSTQVARSSRTIAYAPAWNRPATTATPGAHVDAAALVFFAALAGVGARACARQVRGRQIARKASLVATRPDQAIPWWDRMCKPILEPGIGIWAEKLNMTTVFQEEPGNVKYVPATVLVVKRGGNIVTGKKWPERHGIYSIQVGYERFVPEQWELRSKRALQIEVLARNELPPLRKLKEFRVRPQDWVKYEIGQKLWPSDLFKEGDLVDIHGRSKGKGFQGAIRRWGHKRGPMTHGSKHHRRIGSVGAQGDARVFPGKEMPAWMGDHNHTQINAKILKIIDRIDEDNMPESIIVVEGSVPGYTAHTEQGGSYVYLHISKTVAKADGRHKRDPVWLWYTKKGEGVDQYVPMKEKAWTWKTFWGRDLRWMTSEVKKYWPDGFPGYDHSADPFYDGCDPHVAIKAPEW